MIVRTTPLNTHLYGVRYCLGVVGDTTGTNGNILRLLKDNTAPVDKSLSENTLAKQAVENIQKILHGDFDSTARMEAIEIRCSELKVEQQVLQQSQDQLRLDLGDKADQAEVDTLKDQFSHLSDAFKAIESASNSTGDLQKQLSSLNLNKGDLGYFFPRAEGVEWLETGSIVALCDGQLMVPGPELHARQPIYLVVSDECVLVKLKVGHSV